MGIGAPGEPDPACVPGPDPACVPGPDPARLAEHDPHAGADRRAARAQAHVRPHNQRIG